MSVYKRGKVYQIELRKRGYERLRVSSATEVKATALAMQESLRWLMDRGRRDLLGLVAEGKLLLPDILAQYERDRNNLDHLLQKADEGHKLGELVDEWVCWMASPGAISEKTRGTFAPNTIHRYAASWAKLLGMLKEGRHTKLAELNKGAVADYRVQRISAGCTVSTVNRDLVAIASFLKWCAMEKELEVPVIAIKRQREPSGRERWLSTDELVAVRKACPADWWPLFATLLYSGMRVSEAQLLLCGDVNLGLRSIAIHEGDHRLKTRTSNRNVPIAAPLLPLLASLVSGRNRSEPVFAEPFNSYTAARLAWRRLCLAAGLHTGGKKPKPNARMHDLRHTFGVHAAIAGVPVTSLQALLGHRTAVVTLRYMKYAAEAQRQHQEVSLVVGSMLGDSTGMNRALSLLPAHTPAHNSMQAEESA